MTKITWGAKTPIVPQVSHSTQWWAEDANETKNVVNANDTVDTSASATVLFDQIEGYRHGTWDVPITGDITLDETGAVEGGVAVIIWRGSANPNYIGGIVQSESGIITVDGKYSIYIHYVNSRFNINIFNVANPGQVPLFEDDFTGTSIDTGKWLLHNDNPTRILIEQDENLRFTKVDVTSTTFGDDNITSQDNFPIVNNIILSFDLGINGDVQEDMSTWQIGLFSDRPDIDKDHRIAFSRQATVDKVDLKVVEAGVTVYTPTVTLDFTGATKTVKIILTETNADFLYWTGSAWSSLGDYDHSLTPTDFYTGGIALGNTPAQADGSYISVDNLTIVTTDFTTQRP